MKLLIGIMHTIENEFEKCIDAINNQNYKNFDYFIIENCSNKVAHDNLYQSFMLQKKSYDLFIKIDADMVLARQTFFDEVVCFMAENNKISHYTIPVYDFFTDRLIWGLHIFRNNISWELNNDKIFVDRLYQNVQHHFDAGVLSPAAYHCPDPSDFQAFHFGLHKAIKFAQLGEKSWNQCASLEHWWNMIKMLNNLKKKKDTRLKYAVLGVFLTMKNKLTYKNIDFNNKKTVQLFKKYNTTKKLNKMSKYLNCLDYLLRNKLFLILFLRYYHGISLNDSLEILKLDFKKKFEISF